MNIEVPTELKNNKNKSVLTFLEPLSCHSDIIEPIYDVLKKEKDVKFFCPDLHKFKYCFWYFDDSIFAFGSGMQHIGLLIPATLKQEAIACGATASNAAGKNWFLFPYNHLELPKMGGAGIGRCKKCKSINPLFYICPLRSK